MPSTVGEKDLWPKHIMVKFENTCNKYILKREDVREDGVGHIQRTRNQNNIRFLSSAAN